MAIKPFNSVAGFSVGEDPANIILGNGFITTNGATFTGNIAALGVLTNNLYYANGQPWDLQEPAGANFELQFNLNDDFGASANLTFNPSTNLLSVGGNVDIGTNYFLGNGAFLGGIDTSLISNGTSNVSIPAANSNIQLNVDGNLIANITATGANLDGTLNVTGFVTIPSTTGAIDIALGTPTQGNLTSNALLLTTGSSVSNSIAQLNEILGKLVPLAPPDFPDDTTLEIESLSSYRMANSFTQPDNTPGANKAVAAGTTVTSVRRSDSYVTNNIANVGPGNTGTVTAYLNGADAGNVTLTANLDGNGTYSNLIISNNVDYSVIDPSVAAGFWSVFTAGLSGSVSDGWNEAYIEHSATSDTNTPVWYYDSSTPGMPQFTSISILEPGSPSYTYTSTVPHYNNTNAFDVQFNVNRLSGNMYPTSDTFITGTAGGAFSAPASVTYAEASVATPLPQNLHVSSGSATVTTTSQIISGFGISSTGPSVNAFNSYLTGVTALAPGANVLYKTGTTSSASRIEEANVFIASSFGVGTGLASRIINPGSNNNPTFTAGASLFDSQSSTLQTYDATVVANILKHDQTNYSTGYLPVGPDLSSGRSGTQYFTFRIVRSSVSKFDIKWTGTIAGLWVALPGSIIDSTSGLNGWLDLSTAYAGSGVPGSDIGEGGNGSDGGALGGIAPLNSNQTNKAVTATFGTVSSSNTASNEIYIRIALDAGQSVTALSLQSASN